MSKRVWELHEVKQMTALVREALEHLKDLWPPSPEQQAHAQQLEDLLLEMKRSLVRQYGEQE